MNRIEFEFANTLCQFHVPFQSHAHAKTYVRDLCTRFCPVERHVIKFEVAYMKEFRFFADALQIQTLKPLTH